MNAFEAAVRSTPEVASHLRPRLKALRGTDHQRISCREPRKWLTEPVWDYVVGVVDKDASERAIWVEVHPATAGEIGSVLKKLAWLKGWLRVNAR